MPTTNCVSVVISDSCGAANCCASCVARRSVVLNRSLSNIFTLNKHPVLFSALWVNANWNVNGWNRRATPLCTRRQ